MTCSERDSPASPCSRGPVRACALLLALLLTFGTAQAQLTMGFEITSIDFEGNFALTAKELRSSMTTQETPGFLNKFLHRISEKLGKQNEYLSPVTLAGDLEQLRHLYVSHGFWDVRIDSALTFDTADSTVDILIKINEGYQSTIDTLIYHGLQATSDEVKAEIAKSPRIAQGDKFNSALLEQELSRVLHILSNHGYPNPSYLRDSSSAHYLYSTHNFSVVLTFDHHRSYHFGDIHIRQEIDTLRGTGPRDDITDDIILNQLDYKPGELYNLDHKISSEQNLNRLGIFDLRRLELPVPPESDLSDTIPTFITIRPRDRHEVSPELLVSDENGALNLGTGIGYTHRNFFGGARTFNPRLRFRTQTLGAFPKFFDRGSDAVSNLDLTFEMLQPYIFTNKVHGSWSFSFIVDKEKPYLQNILKNEFSVTDRLAEFTTGVLEWSLESIDLRMNTNFRVDSSDAETVRQLRNIQTQQFNSILSFTISRDMSNDRFSPSEGFIHAATFEEAGLLPLFLKRAIPDIPFTQFYRVNLIGRWYFDLSGKRSSIFALKLRGGIEEKYGETRSNPNRSIPQTHRFYAGGSNSVRGWNSLDLIASGNAQLGGNLLFEGSAEHRWNMLQQLHDGLLDKFWLISFLDLGNVWNEVTDFQLHGLAVAAGFGLRYDTFFGPFRIDWGFRVYNPGKTAGQQWITQRRLLGQTFKEGIFHFGIGHAF